MSDPPVTPTLHRMKSKSALLSSVSKGARIRVEFENVNAFVPVLLANTGPGESATTPASSSTPKERQVLFSVKACVEPGKE